MSSNRNMILSLVLLLLCVGGRMYDKNGRELNERPIIGVFALPSEFYDTRFVDHNYIAGSYVKWVE